MPEYRRHLPHLQPDGATMFLTWRLYDSVPTARRPVGTVRGVRHLTDARIAKIVADTVCAGETERDFYELHAWVIMPNHVHMLITPKTDLSKMRWVKGSTARAANKILGLTGNPFWQDDTWDRWIRNTAEFREVSRYIEWNPVSAGLVSEPALWPWSSAR